MVRLLLSRLNRRCPVCHVQIEGEGVRRGLQVFCCPAHLKQYVEDQVIRERVLRWMGNTKGGPGCFC